jgi:UDP-N-acetylmuramoylalanine--D-glutamate ligase
MTATVVFGFGLTGRSVTRSLLASGDEVTVIDDHPTEETRSVAAELGAALIEAPDTATLAELVTAAGSVVPSPGVPVGHPVFALAAASGVPVVSEIELAWRRLERRRPPRPTLVAVTGTNGKTTVVTLVTAMVEASGLGAVAAGNIGLPLIDAVDTDADVVVAEVSSFQLQFTEGFRPAVSCWLNAAEDHLDWHPSMAHYLAAKARIWAAQGPGDVAVINRDDSVVIGCAGDATAGVPAGVARRTFAVNGPADFGVDRGRRRLVGPDGDIVALADMLRTLPHDLSNAAAAAAVAASAGATTQAAGAVLTAFAGLPHRVQLVAESEGVRWYDDSKATTPASVLAAAAGFDSVVLIAGGRNKGLDLGVLTSIAPPVRAVVAIGEASGEVESAFAGVVPVQIAPSMAEAVSAARRLAAPGDVVLLSPGCASFDWYRSYHERGEDFAAAVAAQLGTGGKDR